jgi:hypothetical protein
VFDHIAVFLCLVMLLLTGEPQQARHQQQHLDSLRLQYMLMQLHLRAAA